VDDDADALWIFEDIPAQAGYDITAVKSGEEALELMKPPYFDVVLSDIVRKRDLCSSPGMAWLILPLKRSGKARMIIF
jgi:CheY-like chemotaxis protein